MKNLKIDTNPKVEFVFNKYPDSVRKRLLELRNLILETASETEEVSNLEETLKWSEPSYLTKYGSTIRIDWKEKSPDQFAIYFKCTSKLVSTFKSIYKNTFEFEGNRAIVFKLKRKIPKTELKHCISMALMYHKIKHLPLLGA